jgi:hypothetical protein
MEIKPAAGHSTRTHSHSIDPGEKQLCGHCSSGRQKEFPAEVAIHFGGLDGLDKPLVWVFPKLRVCLNCGATTLTVPERELRVLVNESPVDGTLIWPKVA